MRETKQTLYELVLGVAFCFILFLLGNIFVSNRVAYTLGLLIGCIIAGVMSGHMYHALEQAMLYDEETAAKKCRRAQFSAICSCWRDWWLPCCFRSTFPSLEWLSEC